ncbi:serine protease 56 isoform X1 [Pygocentrus nattereri]|uniref:Serine protease 56 n=1 Tax=Pygocentrus nattereri TaxID=42514 RepID=A0A3B4ED95_PYGNA|nr:serine protease 56 isoform X1 [Pygocentrus nattereri]
MLLISLLSLMLIGWCAGTPAGREVYRMPQSALKALSDRGTVVLEAALSRALSAVDGATAERSKAEAGCRGCIPCLFQNCGQRLGACAPPESLLMEPSCDVIRRAQSVSDEGERSWALSQACGFYRRRCSTTELNSDSCIRTMGESCSSRVLECSLLNTMQNLEPVTQTRTQAVCGQRGSVGRNLTQPRSRIVGGSPAPPGSWPWLVNLQLDGALMCGGVLVDSSWVLTAAHCFAGSRSESYWTAVVGEFDITKSDPDEQVLKVNRIVTHPKFNQKTFNNDIALVELSSPVVLSERVTPVCLPANIEPPAGTPCLVAGWGSLYEDGPSADVVMEAKVPLLPQSTCRSALGKELLTNTMFCAGYLSGGIDSCQGDSGGPLIFQDRISGRFQLYGITSWGDGCGEKGKPGVYTRVTAFTDWVLNEIQKSVGSREPTCLELLKTSELSEEQQESEFTSLCRFYTLSCPSTVDTAACQRLAQDKCQSRFKKCQLRSFLQSLLDLLQRADDYIRDKVDLTFFTQSLPQLVEHVYSSAVTTRTRRHTPEAEQVVSSSTPAASAWKLPCVFEQVGPLVDDWEKYLNSIAEDLDQHDKLVEAKKHPKEEQLFQEGKESTLHQLEGDLRSNIDDLRSKLASRHAPQPNVRFSWTDFVISSSESKLAPSRTAWPLSDPQSKQSKLSVDNWSTLMLQILSEIELGNQKGQGSDAGSLLSTIVPERGSSLKSPSPSAEKMTAQSQESFVKGTQSPTSSDSLREERLTVTSSTPTPLPLLSQLSSSRKKNELPQRRRRRRLHERQMRGVSSTVCPGVAESAQQVVVTKETYSWILDIAPTNLNMNFQELLVDLTTKNERGLYEARVKATVGGRPLTFYSLVGLENESFYRSMPRIIALALDALKT